MNSFQRLSIAEQTAAHLREGLGAQRWRGRLPGVIRLSGELGVSTHTLRAALRQVEREGLLRMGEDGRSRWVAAGASGGKRGIRIGIFLHDPLSEEISQIHHLFTKLKHSLEQAGYDPFVASETQAGLAHDVRRIGKFLGATPADGWIVGFGTRDVLEWFSKQQVPVIALFGRRGGLPIASVGPDKAPAFVEATRRLIHLGHRRIVLICRRLRRLPQPGRVERAFLDELVAHGIPAAAFNLPDWDESKAGFHALLMTLFRTTPPTALIVDEVPLLIATQQFLAGQRLRVPDQVSLVATDADPSLAWCDPAVAHIGTDYDPAIRRIVRWAGAVSRRRADLKQTLFPARFVPGGTIGPAPPRDAMR